MGIPVVVVVVSLGSAPDIHCDDVSSLRVDDWHCSERCRGRMGRWQRVRGAHSKHLGCRPKYSLLSLHLYGSTWESTLSFRPVIYPTAEVTISSSFPVVTLLVLEIEATSSVGIDQVHREQTVWPPRPLKSQPRTGRHRGRLHARRYTHLRPWYCGRFPNEPISGPIPLPSGAG